MLTAFEVAIHDPSGLSPDMMQKLAYKLIVLGDCVPQTEPGSRCLVDISEGQCEEGGQEMT